MTNPEQQLKDAKETLATLYSLKSKCAGDRVFDTNFALARSLKNLYEMEVKIFQEERKYSNEGLSEPWMYQDSYVSKTKAAYRETLIEIERLVDSV